MLDQKEIGNLCVNVETVLYKGIFMLTVGSYDFYFSLNVFNQTFQGDRLTQQL